MYRNLSLLLGGLTLLATCGIAQPAHAANSRPEREWTMLVFLNGNNNLDSFGAFNINQAEKVGSTDEVAVVVQWASIANRKTQRLLVTRDNDTNTVSSPILQDMGQVDMGDYRNLVEFIRWGVENFPAKHYFVDVWNHGSGWHAINSLNRGGEFHPNDISWDDNTGHSITTKELGQAMTEAAAIIGHKVDLYASDACLMAMVEVAGEMKDSVHVYAGSQELEPGAGWPYDDLLASWNKKSHASPQDVGKILTDTYVKSYQGGSNGSQEVTFSAFDLTQSGNFYAAIRKLGTQLQKLDASSRSAVVNAVRSSQGFYYSDYVDFGDFLAELDKVKESAKIGGELLREVRSAVDSYVVANADTSQYRRATGVSAWIPSSMGTFNSYISKYNALQFQTDTAWADALRYVLQE